MAVPGLEQLDGKLLDGLAFCSIAYDIFEEIRFAPKGLEELRLLTTKRAKRLQEEILPLARYTQWRYGNGERLRIRWSGGNQPYDAFLMGSGLAFEHIPLPRREYLEVTSAVHESDYLRREHLHRHAIAWGARGTRRDPKTRKTISEPSGYGGEERLDELAGILSKAIAGKARKAYRKPVSLIVRCVVDLPIFEGEWVHIVEKVRENEVKHPFREIFLIEHVGKHYTRLSAKPFRRRRATQSTALASSHRVLS